MVPGILGNADLQVVDCMLGDHQAAAPAGRRRLRVAPAAMIGHLAFQVPVIAQVRAERDWSGLAGQVGVRDGVGDDLDDGQPQVPPVVVQRVDPPEPGVERVLDHVQVRGLGRQLQAQRGHRGDEPLRGQGGDVIVVSGAGQRLDGQLADPLGGGRRRCPGEQAQVGGCVRRDSGQLGAALLKRPVRALDQPVAVANASAWAITAVRSASASQSPPAD